MRLTIAAVCLCTTLSAAYAQAPSDQELCRATNDFERSVAACTRIMEAPGASKEWVVWAGYSRALAYDAKGDPDQALANYDLVLSIDPTYLLAIQGRGLAFSKKRDLANAKAAFDKVLSFNPEFIDALYSRGIVHFDLGDMDKALADFTATIALNPAYAAAYSRRAMVYEKKGDFPKAIADYRKSLTSTAEGNIHQQAHAYSKSRLTIFGASHTAPTGSIGKEAKDERSVAKADEPKKEEAKAPPVVVNLGRRVALVIGNTAYQHTDQLENPRNDAAGVAEALRRMGFQEVIDGVDLDAEKLAGKVRDFSRALKGADLAFFYYAGHGVQVNGLNYMMPVDAKLAEESDVYSETIELNDVLKHMERQAKTNIVILDACRNNPLARNLVRGMGSTRSAGATSQGLAEVRSGVGTLILFATQPGNVALDGVGKHSPFTAGLLKHIETPNVDIAIMLRRVRDDVIDITKGQQVPWEHSSLRGAPVILTAGK